MKYFQKVILKQKVKKIIQKYLKIQKFKILNKNNGQNNLKKLIEKLSVRQKN